jgi:hypothetical protein
MRSSLTLAFVWNWGRRTACRRAVSPFRPGARAPTVVGEEASCFWGECAYLPQELDVYCEQCRFNYFTLKGNPPCEDPLTCEHASVPLAHVENYRRWTQGFDLVPS